MLPKILTSKTKHFPRFRIHRKWLSSSTNELIIEEKNSVGLITLNRPKALNALTLSMIHSMHPKLTEWQQDKHPVKLVLVKGAGGKAYCSGGDIRAITEERGGSMQKQFFRDEYHLDHLIGNLKIPYVALLNGIVMGGGVGISVHGKYRVCTAGTMFAMPETGIGLVPDVGGAYFLPRLNGSLGIFLGLTGHRLKGRDCLHAGIATHAVDDAALADLEKELTHCPEDHDTILTEFTEKSTFDKDKEFSLASKLKVIDEIFSAPSVEEIVTRLDGEGSEFSGKTLKTLKRASPSSLKVAFRQISEGKKLKTLGECLNMEHRLVTRCCENDDFYEGVRALLIDRDNKPKWNPSTLEGVSEELVDSYFKPLAPEHELNLK
eukprot:TRINITY_DN8314_c0_g1_i1.p1 TRINITY_DN8314_c0_g1~~TRINITY_DN8314_c0_g1_i1.p1  ORF type:complete len:390 (+),score=55.79 TRINITY_DN8314_c0_g1_i1:42-1172(+)